MDSISSGTGTQQVYMAIDWSTLTAGGTASGNDGSGTKPSDGQDQSGESGQSGTDSGSTSGAGQTADSGTSRGAATGTAAASNTAAQATSKANGVPTALATVTAADTTLAATKKDEVSGSPNYMLQAKSTSQTKTSVKVSWTKVSGAAQYIIYANKCGSKFKKLTTTAKTSLTVKKISGKKLKKGTYYKFLVLAADANGNVLATSKTVHVATKGGKVTNAKKITIKNASKAKKALKKLKVGKSYTIKVTQTKASKKLTLRKHRAVKYESTNSSIAKVSSKGKIKGVAKGTCTIYAYAQDGVKTSIKVTVK